MTLTTVCSLTSVHMQAVQADIDLGAAPFQAALPVNQQTVLMLPDFRRMAGDYHLPGEVQQTLALNILADTHELERVYAQLARRVTAGVESSESVMKWFTGETRAFAVRVIQEGMVTLAHPPTAPFSMAMAGSGAREEMFPGSDLDLAPVTDVVDQHGVAALFEFVQYVEKRLKATMDYLKVKLGLPHELGLGPDTGVFGFARTAELLAKKVVEMQNTGQDATEIYDSQGSAELTTRFERERDTQGTPKHALEQLHGLLVEFPDVDPTAVDEIDIKKGFLKVPNARPARLVAVLQDPGDEFVRSRSRACQRRAPRQRARRRRGSRTGVDLENPAEAACSPPGGARRRRDPRGARQTQRLRPLRAGDPRPRRRTGFADRVPRCSH